MSSDIPHAWLVEATRLRTRAEQERDESITRYDSHDAAIEELLSGARSLAALALTRSLKPDIELIHEKHHFVGSHFYRGNGHHVLIDRQFLAHGWSLSMRDKPVGSSDADKSDGYAPARDHTSYRVEGIMLSTNGDVFRSAGIVNQHGADEVFVQGDVAPLGHADFREWNTSLEPWHGNNVAAVKLHIMEFIARYPVLAQQ